MTVVVVAEKPSVARDIAEVVGARTRAQGWMHGNGYVVTWAIGHLVGLAQPHQVDPAWKAWRPPAPRVINRSDEAKRSTDRVWGSYATQDS